MTNPNMICASLNVAKQLPIKGVYYIGQYGTSGYATAAKGYLYHYFTNGVPITWHPLYFDNSVLDDDNVYDIVVKSLINRPLADYEMVIMHSTPDLWPKYRTENKYEFEGKIIIGYCTWETSQLPKDWVICINCSVNEVWCPSKYNEEVFRNSGVTVPIKVVPHIFLPHNLPSQASITLKDVDREVALEKTDDFTFYSIGELNIRKGIEDTIQTFCKAFTAADPVRMILKVHYKDYTNANKLKCKQIIEDELGKYPNHPQVICLLDNMTNGQMLALHSIGDCYVSLTKSEGFGLTIFDAFNYGKKIITTGYSGHLDFLGESYAGLVKYKIGHVTGMNIFSSNYTEEQTWAYPDLGHAAELMRSVI